MLHQTTHHFNLDGSKNWKDRATFSKTDIREALDNNQFEIYFQPIIDIRTNEILSGEALVRWNHPRLGFLHPMQFITDTEKTGMMCSLGEFVLREACIQSKRWKDSGYPFSKISVNLSLSQLSDKGFAHNIKSIIKETGVKPEDVTLEITESIAMTDPENTIDSLIELKHTGVRIALDDFGAGYSSLSHLQYFPVDELKIDGQFIQNALSNEWSQKIMHSIILFARALGLDAVIEGVETEEQLHLLKDAKVSAVQGFYFTHALPVDEYQEWCMYYLSHPELRG